MTLIDIDATTLSARIASGTTTAEEAMRACLDRIEEVNGQVNAIVALRDADDLMAEARAADAAPRKGWLHGIPVAVKDLANAAGLPTSMGSPAVAGFVPRQDDLFVSRMRAAGAIFIGKTNTPEFGLGSHTVNPVHGPTRNPYDATRSAGGSSGGAAAALAAGMQWVCDGSDMMGSLRNPAGWNNVYGFRPSWGRVPGEPAGDVYLHPLSTSGPMGRSPSDLAHLLDILSGPDPRLPLSTPAAALAGNLETDLTGRKLGWLGDWGGAWPMEDGVIAHCETALRGFEEMGCEVIPLDPPFPEEELWEAWITLRSFAVAARVGPLYDDPSKRALLRDDAIWEVERGRAFTAPDIQRASTIRSRWFQASVAMFGKVDAVLTPTAQCWPFPVDQAHPTQIAGQQMDTYHRWMECVIPASLIGLPSAGVPAGLGPNGLPMGLQITGPLHGDLGVLQLAQGWHQATDWPARAPALRGAS